MCLPTTPSTYILHTFVYRHCHRYSMWHFAEIDEFVCFDLCAFLICIYIYMCQAQRKILLNDEIIYNFWCMIILLISMEMLSMPTSNLFHPNSLFLTYIIYTWYNIYIYIREYIFYRVRIRTIKHSHLSNTFTFTTTEIAISNNSAWSIFRKHLWLKIQSNVLNP